MFQMRCLYAQQPQECSCLHVNILKKPESCAARHAVLVLFWRKTVPSKEMNTLPFTFSLSGIVLFLALLMTTLGLLHTLDNGACERSEVNHSTCLKAITAYVRSEPIVTVVRDKLLFTWQSLTVLEQVPASARSWINVVGT